MSDDEDKKYPMIKFTPEEDKELRRLIVEEKLKNWVTIASRMPGRNVHQCHDRWKNVLSKRRNSVVWTGDEDETLIQKYKILGRRWNKIQIYLPGHSVSQIKSRLQKLEKESTQSPETYIPPKQIEILRKNNLEAPAADPFDATNLETFFESIDFTSNDNEFGFD
ncbi:Myb-like DNA-binding domain containing protein [Trichomonas vaginalis G3]|uniref:Myb-like DNA-binding domain containing protein n=1 Tax=Trichomonas vaginalis (strain ATCC PRA-98 / G3) TaxID=412133 RepID=A2FAM1_TRIV3|nr:RNA polymerase II transcription regulator recruiting protein [Trichomonas vaginalis G3]EAX98064.1 Myb-like DNA-binding domain containing protein [Trichomonas vaginalis G3]KAI5549732.1 RNA polymerase II transcription regulator recruiting protein [Trichomonas vaginalis G3]|eukprot:XP_001310994.1 Myb-like DNA-binding domain containing protein [Trichomonas vaginalis G3]